MSNYSALVLLGLISVLSLSSVQTLASVVNDPASKTLTVSDNAKNLVLRLNYDNKCLLNQVIVRGQDVTPAETGVCSGIQVGGEWFTTRNIPSPTVKVSGNTATVSGIRFGGKGIEIEETWTFTSRKDGVDWKIDRKYLQGGILDDTYFPGWDFNEKAWNGALLGTGGVAWFKLFDTDVATYGVHTDTVSFWNKETDIGLRIAPLSTGGKQNAVRFSRHPHRVFSFNTSVSDTELQPTHGQFRFLRDRQDVWAPFTVKPETVSVEYRLTPFQYSKAYDRGTLKGLDGSAVRDICSTIARLGAIDTNIHGSNGWYSGYAVLHEQWIAQLGLAIDDPAYFKAYSQTLDYQRDNAVGTDGRVLSRWYYNAGDSMPGTYTKLGFYECQWGWLMDTQPCFVTNVAEQFQYTGDVEWVRKHKVSCERVLDYLLKRDSNGNGLVEMMTDNLREHKSSDWIDIVWASFENGYVNIELYNALNLWSDIEEILGDTAQTQRYRQIALKLKTTINKPLSEGGLWDPEHQCYSYWRDKDGSVHGVNSVTPVNFMALAYGLCDDPTRRKAILDSIEDQMQREKLFIWPLCMTSYTPEEGGGGPFPTYENGDIFLGWAEVGIRAYASYQPEVAVRCVKNVLAQYAKDGLAFQRYLRKTQTGEGDDILSNMANPIVGLYRDIYGIQPQWNRLLLDPHITSELKGTKLKYALRGQDYVIDLKVGQTKVAVDGFSVSHKGSFAIDVATDTLRFFQGLSTSPALTITRPPKTKVAVTIHDWPDGAGTKKWTVNSSADTKQTVQSLPPMSKWTLNVDGDAVRTLTADSKGVLTFTQKGGFSQPLVFELKSVK